MALEIRIAIIEEAADATALCMTDLASEPKRRAYQAPHRIGQTYPAAMSIDYQDETIKSPNCV